MISWFKFFQNLNGSGYQGQDHPKNLLRFFNYRFLHRLEPIPAHDILQPDPG
jgi:hypothetical protein